MRARYHVSEIFREIDTANSVGTLEKVRKMSDKTDSSNDKSWGTSPDNGNAVWGVDRDGNDVTYATNSRGDTFLADGHAETSDDFWGDNGAENHDHYGTGKGPNGNGTQRGKYTGWGS